MSRLALAGLLAAASLLPTSSAASPETLPTALFMPTWSGTTWSYRDLAHDRQRVQVELEATDTPGVFHLGSDTWRIRLDTAGGGLKMVAFEDEELGAVDLTSDPVILADGPGVHDRQVFETWPQGWRYVGNKSPLGVRVQHRRRTSIPGFDRTHAVAHSVDIKVLARVGPEVGRFRIFFAPGVGPVAAAGRIGTRVFKWIPAGMRFPGDPPFSWEVPPGRQG